MNACFHTAGVQCDNCRTALNGEPYYANKLVTSDKILYIHNAKFEETPETALARLEATVEDLRSEMRALSKLMADHIAAGKDTLCGP